MKKFSEWVDNEEGVVSEGAGSKLAKIASFQKENTKKHLDKLEAEGDSDVSEMRKIRNAWVSGGRKGTLTEFAKDWDNK